MKNVLKERVEVLILGKVPKIFDYWFILDQKFPKFLQRGHRVLVPFRGGFRIGLLLGPSLNIFCPEEKLLNISAILDEGPIFSNQLLTFVIFFSKWWVYPIEQTLIKIFPNFLMQRRSLTDRCFVWQIKYLKDNRWSWHRNSIKNIKDQWPWPQALATHHIQKTSTSFFDIEKQCADVNVIHFYVLWGTLNFRKSFYLSKIRSALDQKETLLLIFPSLVALEFYKKEFNFEEIVVYHAKMTIKSRMESWNKILCNESIIIFGLASSIWLPFQKKIQVIVEQEDSEYYQQSREPGLHLRDVLLGLQKQSCSPFSHVFFGTETPSLEIFEAMHQKKIEKISEDFFSLQNVRKIKISREHLNFSGNFSNILIKRMSFWIQKKEDVCIIASHAGSKSKLYCYECKIFCRCPKCLGIFIKDANECNKIYCATCRSSEKLIDKCFCGKNWNFIGIGTADLAANLLPFFKKNQILYEEKEINFAVKKSFFSKKKRSSKVILLTMKQAQELKKDFNFGAIILLGIDTALHSSFADTECRWMRFCAQLHQRLNQCCISNPEIIFLTNYSDHPLMQQLIAGNFESGAQYLLAQRKSHHLSPYFCWVGAFVDVSNCIEDLWNILMELKNQLLKKNQHDQCFLKILGPLKKRLDRRPTATKTGIILGTSSQILTRKILKETLNHLKNRLQSFPKYSIVIEWNSQL